jgi:phospholipid/cholesterol/gamma-HCH transport system ATP-binding protein
MTQTENDVVIRLRGIRNQFGSHVVHDNLDLDVYRGEVLGVVGASGTGKSVLLRTIAGLQSPKAGEIEVLGTNVRTASEADRQALERRWGVMFQDGARECRGAAPLGQGSYPRTAPPDGRSENLAVRPALSCGR